MDTTSATESSLVSGQEETNSERNLVRGGNLFRCKVRIDEGGYDEPGSTLFPLVEGATYIYKILGVETMPEMMCVGRGNEGSDLWQGSSFEGLFFLCGEFSRGCGGLAILWIIW